MHCSAQYCILADNMAIVAEDWHTRAFFNTLGSISILHIWVWFHLERLWVINHLRRAVRLTLSTVVKMKTSLKNKTTTKMAYLLQIKPVDNQRTRQCLFCICYLAGRYLLFSITPFYTSVMSKALMTDKVILKGSIYQWQFQPTGFHYWINQRNCTQVQITLGFENTTSKLMHNHNTFLHALNFVPGFRSGLAETRVRRAFGNIPQHCGGRGPN